MQLTAELKAATAAAVLLAASGAPGEARHAEIPMVTRLAPIQQVNAETRTVTLTWTTGADVTRYDWWTGKRYIEQLDVSEGACDLSRLNGGAPLLNSHQMMDLGDQIGVVERAWIENGVGKAEVRFPQEGVDPAADLIFKKVQDKIIRNVSVGYNVSKYQITDNQGDGLDVWRAVAWQPAELSLVTIPADAGAGVRSATETLHPCEFVRAAPASTKETPMTTKTDTVPNPSAAETEAQRAASAETQRLAHEAATRQAVETERHRVLDIQGRVAAAGLPLDFAADLIGRGIAAEHAGNHIIDEMAKRGVKPPVPAGEAARVTQDEVDTRRDAVTEALLHRANPGVFKLTERAREWRGMRLMDIARDLLTARGEKVRGMGPMELAGRALATTSDFPQITANVANKSLQAGYAAEARTFLPFCTQHDAADFKQISSVQMGEGSNLELVNEQGEFKRGAISESAEKWNLLTYGKVFAFSRQLLINDDMGAFTRVPFLFGAAGVRIENDIVWAILTANANMADSVALFHATHSNLQTGAGSALQLSSLQTMRKNFRTQKGLDAKQTLNLLMKYIMVPAALESSLEQLMTTIFPAQTSNVVNNFVRSLTPIVEARLDANSTTAWYGAADPSAMPTIEYGYLEGNDGVFLETRNGFDTDGVEFKARHDFGAKAVNFRGLQKSAGA